MSLTFIERGLGTLQNASTSSNTQTLHLPREHLYSRMAMRVVFPTSTTNNYTANAEDLAVDRIEVIANGQLVLKSYAWKDLVEMNKFRNGVTAVDKTALGAAKTAGYSSCIVDFALRRDDLSSLVPSYLFSSFDLKITWAAKSVWGGDDAILPYVEVFSRELLFTEELRGLKYAFNKETTLASNPTATGFNEVSLTIANVYRSVFMRANGGASTGYQDTTVTDVEVVQDGVIYHRKLTWLGLAAFAKQERQLETRPAGAALLDFDVTNDGAATVDSAPFSTFKVRANVASVTNAVTLTYVPQELIYPRA